MTPQPFSRTEARKISGFVLGAVVTAVLLAQLWQWWGMSAGAATGLASAAAASFLLAFGLTKRSLRRPRPPGRAQECAVAVLSSVPQAAVVVAIGLILGLPAAASVAIALAIVGVQIRKTLRAAAKLSYQALIRRPMGASSEARERELEIYADRLGDRKLSVYDRAEAEIRRAETQVAQAALGGRREELHEAFEVLVRHASTPASDARGWDLRYLAASELVAAWDVHADRHRSAPGYERALALLESLVESAPDDELSRTARAAHALAVAQYCSWRIRELASAMPSDWSPINEVRDHGVRVTREALVLVPQGSPLWTQLVVASATLHLTDGERGIVELRSALRSLADRPLTEKAPVQLALASVLILAYDEAPETNATNLDEAEELLRALVEHGPLDAYARAQLHDIAQIRESEEATDGQFNPPPPADPCEHAREAYAKARGWDIARVTVLARTWAECAAAHGRVGEAADAYWELVGALPRELERRYTLGEARRLAGEMQGIAAEAAYWLLLDDRPEDAVVALELARAVLLGQRTTRIPTGLREELLGRGLTSLWKRFEDAATRLEKWDREEYARPENAVVESFGIGPDHGMAAWSAYRRVLDELRAALGEDHALLERTSLDQVRRVARNRPLAYLFAADGGGGIVLVGCGGEISDRLLPGLKSSTVQDRAEQLQELLRRPEARADAWEALLDELARDVVDDLIDVLGTASSVVVIAVGALALLPLHAIARGRLTVRYAPSARTLLATMDDGRPASPADSITILGVADPGAAVDEADAVARLYTDHRLIRNPTVAMCLEHLGAAEVWHFTGHAQASSVDPVQGRLIAADGPLLLKDLLARRRGAGVLAVLSACETNVPATTELDEALTFPAVLLAGGMRTVVATAWQVDRTAALMFSLYFHRLILAGNEPADAVALAASWLRRSDNGALERASDGHYRPPAWATTPERLSAWRTHKPWSAPFYWAAFTVTGG